MKLPKLNEFFPVDTAIGNSGTIDHLFSDIRDFQKVIR